MGKQFARIEPEHVAFIERQKVFFVASAPPKGRVNVSPKGLSSFRVLGDRTRLRVLELVAERERSVGELVTLLGEPQSKVSNHLACLRWCGFVATRREHRTIHYRLADERVTAVVELGRGLLHDNAEHIAACGRVDAAGC